MTARSRVTTVAVAVSIALTHSSAFGAATSIPAASSKRPPAIIGSDSVGKRRGGDAHHRQ